MPTTTETFISEMLEAAPATLGNVARTGLGAPRTLLSWWTTALTAVPTPGQAPEAIKGTLTGASEAVNRNAEEAFHLAVRNTRTGFEQVAKAGDAWRSESPIEARMRVDDLLKTPVDVIHANARIAGMAVDRLLGVFVPVAEKPAPASKSPKAKIAKKS